MNIARGAKKALVVTFVDDSAAAIDLTGRTVRVEVKKHVDDDTALITKLSSDATQIEYLTQSGSTLGKARVYFVPSDTQALDIGRYYLGAWLDDPPGAGPFDGGPTVQFNVYRAVPEKFF